MDGAAGLLLRPAAYNMLTSNGGVGFFNDVTDRKPSLLNSWNYDIGGVNSYASPFAAASCLHNVISSSNNSGALSQSNGTSTADMKPLLYNQTSLPPPLGGDMKASLYQQQTPLAQSNNSARQGDNFNAATLRQIDSMSSLPPPPRLANFQLYGSMNGADRYCGGSQSPATGGLGGSMFPPPDMSHPFSLQRFVNCGGDPLAMASSYGFGSDVTGFHYNSGKSKRVF